MSVLHRAVSELAEVTTFRESSPFPARRSGRGYWFMKAASHVEVDVGTEANRLHQAICALVEVATFSRARDLRG